MDCHGDTGDNNQRPSWKNKLWKDIILTYQLKTKWYIVNFKRMLQRISPWLVHLDRAVNFPKWLAFQPKTNGRKLNASWMMKYIRHPNEKSAAATEALNGWFAYGSFHGLWQALDKLFFIFSWKCCGGERLTKGFPRHCSLMSELHCSPVKTQPEAGPEGPKIDDTFSSSDNEVLILC